MLKPRVVRNASVADTKAARPLTVSGSNLLQSIVQDIFAMAIFFGLGSAVLAPYNAFVMAIDYFEQRYPGMHMERRITLSYLPCASVVLVLTSVLYPIVSVRTRIVTMLIGFAIATMVVPTVSFKGGGVARVLHVFVPIQ